MSSSRRKAAELKTKEDLKRKADTTESEEDSDSEEEGVVSNKFANDGSFLEMFKKMQQQQQSKSTDLSSVNTSKNQSANAPATSAESSSAVVKSVETKRKPKVLKVGVIKKQRPAEDDAAAGDDSNWSRYMREVRQIKEKLGDEEPKNRPLVK